MVVIAAGYDVEAVGAGLNLVALKSIFTIQQAVVISVTANPEAQVRAVG